MPKREHGWVVMRWFTRDWYDGQVDTDPSPAYESRLRELELPAQLQELARLSLHDGLFMEYALEGPDVRFRIHCGNLQSGYRELTLLYKEGRVSGAGPEDVTAWLSAPDTEILYDELDVDAGRYEHRFLLRPTGEFGVSFSELAMNDVSVDDSYRSKRFEGL